MATLTDLKRIVNIGLYHIHLFVLLYHIHLFVHLYHSRLFVHLFHIHLFVPLPLVWSGPRYGYK